MSPSGRVISIVHPKNLQSNNVNISNTSNTSCNNSTNNSNNSNDHGNSSNNISTIKVGVWGFWCEGQPIELAAHVSSWFLLLRLGVFQNGGPTL